MPNKIIKIRSINADICLVPRAQLRRTTDGRTFSLPVHLKAMLAKLPTAPSVFSWSKNNTVQYPILGNNRYGDCFYTACCHAAQTWTANAGTECSFDAASVIARYLKIAGGDNGLDDMTMMPEWRSGIIGPNGPHKILDEMTVNPRDDASTALAMWAFAGLVYTAALSDSWVANPGPGDVWDASTPNPDNGHATTLTGKTARGMYELQTWGFSPSIYLTPNGLKSSDPELIVAFSLEMFNSQGISPAGMTYEQAAALWVACGGKALPPSPFPPAPAPGPVVPPAPIPVPATQATLALAQSLPPGVYILTKRP